MNPESINPGDVLYDCHRYRMGNTTISTLGVWKVHVLEMFLSQSGTVTARASWNGNEPVMYSNAQLRRLRRSPPEWIARPFLGGTRCHVCSALKQDGHLENCSHPKAVAARKKASKVA